MLSTAATSCVHTFGQAPVISYQTPSDYKVGRPIDALTPSNSGGSVSAVKYGTLSAFAGSGLSGQMNGTGAAASFKSPIGLAKDNAGNLYVADRDNYLVRKIAPDGTVSRYAGDNSFVNAGGPPALTELYAPLTLAADNANNIYIGLTNTHNIKKATPGVSLTTGFAGAGISGYADGTGPAARFNLINAVRLDNDGNLIIADGANNRIRKVTPAGVVNTFAGTGQRTPIVNGAANVATFDNPLAIAIDRDGNIYVGEASKIRKITPAGTVSTFAGTNSTGDQDGPIATANFNKITGMCFDANGTLYVADNGNNKIKRISVSGLVTTIVARDATHADFSVNDIIINNDSYLYASDQQHFVVRKINLSGYIIDKPLPVGLTFNDLTGEITGTPTVISPATVYTIIAQNAFGFSTASLTIKVDDNSAPANTAPIISYQTPQIFVVGTPVDLPVLNTGGAVPSGGFTISTPLPAGLNLNADDGRISGTPTAPSPATIYTVTATGIVGQSQATINIKVNAAPPAVVTAPVISYETPKTYPPNQPIPPLLPTNTGGVVRRYSIGLVNNFAGTGESGRTNGPKNSARFDAPFQLARNNTGDYYIADLNNFAIRKLTAAGIISTYAGMNGPGDTNGPANASTFRSPRGIAVDKAGNVYVADNFAIRKITPVGVVSTLAGGTTAGYVDGTGAAAQFDGAVSLAIDQSDNLYVADFNNLLIRKVTPAGVVTTLAGNRSRGHLNGQGNAATFDGPAGLTIDATGNLYVADYLTIRKINPGGLVTTIAGNGTQKVIDGPAMSASFGIASGIALNSLGDIYVLDTGNDVPNESSDVLRLIDKDGTVSTVSLVTAGGSGASLLQPLGIITDADGVLYISGNNNYIQTVSFDKYTIDKPLPAGLSFDEFTGAISGTPTVLSPPTNYTVTASNSGGSSSYTVNIQIKVTGTLTPTIITFPNFTFGGTWDSNYNIDLKITSNNNETPIIITSSNPAVATINPDGTMHVVREGLVTITATQAGNANFSAAVPVSQSVLIGKDDQVITFPIIADKAVCDADFSAGITSTGIILPIQYTSSNNAVATISSAGIIHILGPGTTTITASQPDAELYNAAVPVSRLLTVIATAQPPINITATSTTIYEGESITFTVMETNADITTNYQWQINGIDAGVNSPTYTTTQLRNNDRVTCVVTTNLACTTPVTSEALIITVSKPVTAIIPPNTFTPNNDGVNDTWSIPALSLYPTSQVSIYNRNGTLLLQSTGYNKAWDGNYKGRQLPAGVYYYIIDTNGAAGKISGSVTIVR